MWGTKYVDRGEGPKKLFGGNQVKGGGGTVNEHPAIVVVALGLDDQVLAEIVAGKDNISAPEASVIFDLDLPVNQNEQSRVA